MNIDKKCTVAILAGGQGTRLKDRSGNLPKPMVPICGKPVLEYQIELCRLFGFSRIALLVHHEAKLIKEYFGDGSRWNVDLTYVDEEEPRGTAGALLDALSYLENEFLVLYADTYADVNLLKFWQKSQKCIDSVGSLLLHPNDHPYDSDLIEINEEGYVVGISPYPHKEELLHRNLVNAALYYLKKDHIESFIPKIGKSDLAKDIFPKMLDSGFKFQTYITPEYIKDMGTPERLDKVQADLDLGLPERLSDRDLRSAVFLDRDGTINQEVGHLNSSEKLELIPGSGAAIRRLNRSGVLAIAVTNQPVLARGDVTWTELNHIHAKLDQLLGDCGAYLDGLYICPHHPDRGFFGEVSELKIDCDCRKPKTGLIDKAVTELLINRRESWMVGDSTSDILAGKMAGLHTVLVQTGHSGLDRKYDVQPDYIFPELSTAVEFILNGRSKIIKQLVNIYSSAFSSRLILLGGCARSGKSTVASVISGMLAGMGRKAHVISLDGWLKPLDKRKEGCGVLNRYDMDAIKDFIIPLLLNQGWSSKSVPQYNRRSRSSSHSITHSIGPQDIFILEGVTALLDEEILKHAEIKIYVDVSDEVRIERLKKDYAWRDFVGDDYYSRLASRDIDEVVDIRASALHATNYVMTS